MEIETQIDKVGRISIPGHIRRRLGIYKKTACIRIEIKSVVEVYEGEKRTKK